MYSDTLWDKIDVVIDHWENEREATNDLLNYYLRIRKLTLAYADGLDKQQMVLTSKREIKQTSHIAYLQSYVASVSRSHRDLAESLLTISKPLQATLDLQAVGLKDLILNGKKHAKKLLSFRKKQQKIEKPPILGTKSSFLNRIQVDLGIQLRRNSTDSAYSLQSYIEDNANEMKRIIDALQMHEIDRHRITHQTMIRFAELAKTQGEELTNFSGVLQEVISR